MFYDALSLYIDLHGDIVLSEIKYDKIKKTREESEIQMYEKRSFTKSYSCVQRSLAFC